MRSLESDNLTEEELAAIIVGPPGRAIAQRDRIMAEAKTPPTQKLPWWSPQADAIDQIKEFHAIPPLLGC